jgi:hypothetical protein
LNYWACRFSLAAYEQWPYKVVKRSTPVFAHRRTPDQKSPS